MSNKRIKVLHLIDSEGVYGAERVILNLSIAHRDSADIEPMVGCLVPHAASENALYDAAVAADLEAIRLPVSNARVWLDLPRVAHTLRACNIGLVHAHGYKAAVYGFFIRLLTGIPVISTCHLWFEPERGPLKMRVMVALEKWLYRWFPKILAVSANIRQTLIAHGVAGEKIDVIVNGVDVSHLPSTDAQRMALRRELGIGDDEYCILNAARLTRQKAQWLLIDAAARLKALGLPFKLLIVGAGELQAELETKIRADAVSDCVKLLGFRADVPQLLDISDVFVLPSLDEGMPMSLLEAAAARVPIVATAVGDIPKLVRDRESGLIVPLNDVDAIVDAVTALRADNEFAARLADAAHRSLVANYSCRAMSESYLRVYRELLKLPSTASAGSESA